MRILKHYYNLIHYEALLDEETHYNISRIPLIKQSNIFI